MQILKKILIINPFGIGDCLFTTPVAKAIKDTYPQSYIGYWCNMRVEDILKRNPYIDKIFALSRGDIKKIYRASKWRGISVFLKLLYRIKREKFELALDFSLDQRYSLISKIIGIKRRLGYNYKNRGIFLTAKLPLTEYWHRHVTEYYLDLLHMLDIHAKTYNLILTVTQEDKFKGRDILAKHGARPEDLIIGIAPGAGASWGKDASFKHWPAENFAKLADALIKQYHAKVIILGDELEMPIAQRMMCAMSENPIDLAGKTTLRELISVISNLQIMVANDGGPLHMAVAEGIKTVSIFGPVDENVYGPYPESRSHIVVSANINCRPCYEKFRMPVCDRYNECMNSISAERVFEAVKQLIN